jgi:hypothetical protein
MKTRAQVAEELVLKEERISAWEKHNLLDNDHWQYEDPRVENWYIE